MPEELQVLFAQVAIVVVPPSGLQGGLKQLDLRGISLQ